MANELQPRLLVASRFPTSKGLIAMAIAALVLFALSFALAPSSVAPSTVSTMLPFAAVLAVVGIGQMLVIQQAGVDLSVPGAMSLAVVVSTHFPSGNDSLLGPAILMVYAFALGAGLFNGFMVARLGLNAIIATLGTNALFYGAVLGISGGTPTGTTQRLRAVVDGSTFGIPNAVFFALIITVVVLVVLRKTVAGRRFESIGASAPATRAMGLGVRKHKGLAYVWAQLLYATAGIMLAGITAQPTAYMGDQYLLPSVAVVVLGGTSLLGGRGFPFATIAAALFLTQLDQFTLALGVPYAVRTLVQAAALAVGVALYTLNFDAIRSRYFPQNKVSQATPA